MPGESPISLDLQARIAEWRRKAAIGELTLEETREAVALIRQGRLAAGQAAARAKGASRKASAPATADTANSLLDALDDI